MNSDTEVSRSSRLDDFLRLCSTEITRRAAIATENSTELRSGAQAFATAIADATPTQAEITRVPVVDYLDLRPTQHEQEPRMTAALAALNEITWVVSHRLTDGGTEAALAPLNEVRDLGKLTCGLLLLGPNCTYPDHSHPPQELYLPLSGHGLWRYGGATGRSELARDTLVYNHPNDTHAVVARDALLLALYVLWPDQ